MPVARLKTTHPEGGPLMTKQADAAATDVNNIMNRWINRGIAPLPDGRIPRYGDFSDGADFADALNQVREAEAQFAMLPAHIRDHCDNNPERFLTMVYDPTRRQELIDLGLIEAQIPDAALATPDPAPAPEPAPAPIPGP